ncbi:MAG TPA: chemotaxis protein CheW [Syntrophobacteraceae bacterium]|nr:chemotaxis protein CheW [Syntrophobacteraceae bacterium]
MAKLDQQQNNLSRIEGKYLMFSLNGEEYGIGILKVKEIIGIMPVTTIPQTPDFVKGVFNLRGKVIPVIDLKVCFGMPSGDYNDRTAIIVTELKTETQLHTMGMVVDSVSEVKPIKAGEIGAPPAFGVSVAVGCILGMAKSDGKVRILLNIDKVLKNEETASLDQAA